MYVNKQMFFPLFRLLTFIFINRLISYLLAIHIFILPIYPNIGSYQNGCSESVNECKLLLIKVFRYVLVKCL